MGRIAAICISEKKGTVKKEVERCVLKEDYGLEAMPTQEVKDR